MTIPSSTSGSSSAAAAAAAAARRAEEARRRAEEARRRAEEARKRAEKARQQAEKARKAQLAAQKKVQAAERDLKKTQAQLKTKGADKPTVQQRQALERREDRLENRIDGLQDKVSTQQSRLDAARTELDKATRTLQSAEEKVVKTATDATRKMQIANDVARVEGKPPPFTRNVLRSNEVTTKEAVDAVDGATAPKRNELQRTLSTELGAQGREKVAAAIESQATFDRLQRDPKLAGVLRDLDLRSGQDLQGFGDRLAKEARGKSGGLDKLDLRNFPDQAALASVIKTAGETLTGDDRQLLTDPNFAGAVSRGRSPKRAGIEAKLLGGDTPAGLQKMGVSLTDFDRMSVKDQRAFAQAAKDAAAGKFEDAIGRLGEIGKGAKDAITTLAPNLEDGASRRLLENPDAVAALLGANKGADAISEFADGKTSDALRALGGEIPKSVVSQLTRDEDFSASLNELGIPSTALDRAGGALPDLLDAAASDEADDRVKFLAQAVQDNPELGKALAPVIAQEAQDLEKGDSFGASEIKLLSDPTAVQALATKKNAAALAELGKGELQAGLEAIRGPMPKPVMESLLTDSNLQDTLTRYGLSSDDIRQSANGKALAALVGVIGDGEVTNNTEAQEVADRLLDAAIADPKLGAKLAPGISEAFAKQGIDGVTADIFTNEALVTELAGTRNGASALKAFLGGEGTVSLADGLRKLGDKVPSELTRTILQSEDVRDDLDQLGLNPDTLYDAGKALPTLIEASGETAKSTQFKLMAKAMQELPKTIATPIDGWAAARGVDTPARMTNPLYGQLATAVSKNASALLSGPKEDREGLDEPTLRMLSDATFTQNLATSDGGPQAISELGSGQLSKAVSRLDGKNLKDAIGMIQKDPDFAERFEELGLNPSVLSNANKKALPQLVQALQADELRPPEDAPPGQAQEPSAAESLVAALQADKTLLKSLAPALAKTVEDGPAKDVFSDPKLVEQLSKLPNGSGALTQLAKGDTAAALAAFGKEPPKALAEKVWPSVSADMQKYGVTREAFLDSGSAMSSLVKASEADEPEDEAVALTTAMTESPALRAKLAGALPAIAAQMEPSPEREVLSNPSLVTKIAAQKDGARVLEAMAQGELVDGIVELKDKALRADVIGVAAKEKGFAEGLKQAGLTLEQLKTAPSEQLKTLVGKAEGARDAAALQKMLDDDAAPSDVAEKLRDLIAGESNPAYRSELLRRFGPGLGTLAARVSDPNGGLDGGEIEATMNYLGKATEKLSDADQVALSDAFAKGIDDSENQTSGAYYRSEFDQQLEDSMTGDAGTTFAARLSQSLEALDKPNAADSIRASINNAYDRVLDDYGDAMEDYGKFQQQLTNAVKLAPSPEAIDEITANLRAEYKDDIEAFEDVAGRLGAMMNGASVIKAQYSGKDDLLPTAERMLDQANDTLEKLPEIQDTQAGQDLVESMVQTEADGGRTLLSRAVETSTGLSDGKKWLSNLSKVTTSAMTSRMASLVEAGDWRGAQRIGDALYNAQGLLGLDEQTAAKFRYNLQRVLDPRIPATDRLKIQAQRNLQELSSTPQGGGWDGRSTGPGVSLKLVGMAASGLSVYQGLSSFGEANAAQQLQTVWSGFELGADSVGLASRVFGTGALEKTLGKFTGPVGGVVGAVTGTMQTIDAFESGDIAGGILSGASTIGGVLMMCPATFWVGLGIEVGAVIAGEIVGAFQQGASEDKVKDALKDGGVNDELADILSKQTGDKIGVGGALERVSKELGLRTDQLIDYLNEIPEGDDRLDLLRDYIVGDDDDGLFDTSSTGLIGEIHEHKSDDGADGSANISDETIQKYAQQMQEWGLAPA